MAPPIPIEAIISPRSRPPAGIVQRMAQERETRPPLGAVKTMAHNISKSKSGSSPPRSASTAAASAGHDAAAIHRIKLARAKTQRAKSHDLNSVASRGNQSLPSSSAEKDKYEHDIANLADSQSTNSVGNRSWLKSVPNNETIRMAAHSYMANAVNGASTHVHNSSSNSYHVGLTSLLSDDATIESMAEHNEITDTELYQKFEEAFNLTLQNNPGILPGAPTVVNSIKKSLHKVQKAKVQKEMDMRKQLDKLKNETDLMEAQLRKEMGKNSLRRIELTKELEDANGDQDLLQDKLTKQIDAIHAAKRELNSKMNDVTKEKEELTKHLGFLSKSRGELEEALETEMKLVEKDRDELQKVVAARKKLQKQKAENKELEGKIEKMTDAASKEKKALQAEVVELKKFEEHLLALREQNEQTRKELEEEKLRLKETAELMQMKKTTLMESVKDIEAQYQKEIDELEGRFVSSYFKPGGGIGGGGGAGTIGGSGSGAEEDRMKREIFQLREELELAKTRNTSSHTLPPSRNHRRDEIREEIEEDRMKREIVQLRDELELAKSRNTSSHTLPPSRNHHRDETREEIENLRAEIQRHNIGPSAKYSSMPSPTMTPRSPRFGRGGIVARMRDELDLVQTRNPRNSLSSTRNNHRGGAREEIDSLRSEIQSPPQYGGGGGGGAIGGLYESRLQTPNESRFYTPNENRLFTPNESRMFTPKERRVFTPNESRVFTPQARRYFS